MSDEIINNNNSTNITTSVKRKHHEISNGTDAKIKEELQCTVCFTTPQDEIYMCTTSHSLCSRCYKKVKSRKKECPTCKKALADDQRNHAGEKIISLLCFDCDNKDCEFSGNPAQLKEHKRKCEYRIVCCSYKFLGCTEKVKQLDIQEHETKCQYNFQSWPHDKITEWMKNQINSRRLISKSLAQQQVLTDKCRTNITIRFINIPHVQTFSINRTFKVQQSNQSNLVRIEKFGSIYFPCKQFLFEYDTIEFKLEFSFETTNQLLNMKGFVHFNDLNKLMVTRHPWKIHVSHKNLFYFVSDFEFTKTTFADLYKVKAFIDFKQSSVFNNHAFHLFLEKCQAPNSTEFTVCLSFNMPD